MGMKSWAIQGREVMVNSSERSYEQYIAGKSWKTHGREVISNTWEDGLVKNM